MTTPNAIAIIGLSGRFPGADTLAQFWENLKSGKETISHFSVEELIASGVPEQIARDPDYVAAKGILSDIAGFDANFFGFSPREASHMDPQHRIFLECAWQALEDAGYDPLTAKHAIGLYAGCGDSTYLYHLLQSKDSMAESAKDPTVFFGNFRDFFATRVAYRLNLKGPSINIQTACSSSLVAVHSACTALLSYECDMALAGGIHVSVPHKSGNFHQKGGVVSPDGHCRAFDAAAAGTVASDGVGVVVLKRLDDALTDGDHIQALILGSAANNDGADKIGYTAPSVRGQAQVITMAQEVANVDPVDISYIEAHGTGTKLGDPIEIEALNQAFRRKTCEVGFCAIGSLKTNIGHLDAAAGVAGLIKIVLALKHGQLPASLNYERPNPDIDFANSPFFVNHTLQDWRTRNDIRIAGVSSFGIGGTNAHVVLAQAPNKVRPTASDRPELVVLSARTASALAKASEQLGSQLQDNPDTNLADASFTLQSGRHAFEHRLAIVARDCNEALTKLKAAGKRASTAVPQRRQRLAFLYPGQGLQCVGMGYELYLKEPVFQKAFDRGIELANQHLQGKDLKELIYPANHLNHASDLVQTQYAQPALFIVQYALTRYLASLGLRADVMLGHSIGEWVAACEAGVFSFEDAVKLVCSRARLMQECPTGSMLGVELNEQELAPYLDDHLEISVHNSERWLIVSGAHANIEALRSRLETDNVRCHALRVSHAFHSESMQAAAQAFVACFAGIHLSKPERDFISNVTGTWITDAQATSPNYWADQLRAPVRFDMGLRLLQAQADLRWLEVGPGQALSMFARMSGQNEISCVWPKPSDDTYTQTLAAIGQLWMAGLPVDFSAIHRAEQPHRIPLPTYPFERQPYWVQQQPALPSRAGNDTRQQPRLDAGQDHLPVAPAPSKDPNLSNWFYVPSWQEIDPPSAGSVPCKRATLLLVRQDNLQTDRSSDLQQALAGLFEDCVIARDAKAFKQISACEFELDLTSRQDYEALFAALAHQAWQAQRILHAANLGSVSPDLADPDPELALTRYLELLSLAQATVNYFQNSTLEIIMLANQVIGVTHEDQVAPDKATVLGPLKVIPLEYPNLTCRLIDLDSDTLDRPTQLLGEIQSSQGRRVVACRQGKRYAESYESKQLPAIIETEGREKLRPLGHYLITGGLGGVGLAIAEYLVRSVKAKVTLVNRSALPPREQWSSLIRQESLPDLSAHTETIGQFCARWSNELGIKTIDDHPGLSQALLAHAQNCVARYFLSAVNPGQTITLGDLRTRLAIEPRFERMYQFMLGVLVDTNQVTAHENTLQFNTVWPVATDDLCRQFPEFEGLIRFIDQCTAQYPDALSGKIPAIEVLYPEGQTDRLDAMQRDTIEYSQQRVYSHALKSFLDSLAERRPLRVLEIGGGQGLLTRVLAPSLLTAGCSYHFTDISPFFINRIKTALPALEAITTGIYDITREPTAQGLEPQSFDVIVGLDVVHATADIGKVLRYLRQLLTPSGYLSLIETVTTGPWVDLCWGLADGWWLYEDQNLRNSALMHPRQWEQVLLTQDFAHHVTLPERDEDRDRSDVCLILAQTPESEQNTWLPNWQAEASQDPQTVNRYRISRVLELEALGGSVNVVAADICNATQVNDLIAHATDTFGPIQGVVHCAMVLEDKLMQLKDHDSARRVFAPKVHGSLNLLRGLQTQPLDFFVHCSSLAAPMGLYAQSDYCSATAFQDALAHWMKPGIELSINWGVWRDAGFAMRMKMNNAGALARWQKLSGPLLTRATHRQDGTITLEGALGPQWLVTEHRLNGMNTLPGTGYLTLLNEAAATINGLVTYASPIANTISDLIFTSPLTVEAHQDQPIRLLLTPKDDHCEVVITSLRGTHWVEHARCQIQAASALDQTAAPFESSTLDSLKARFSYTDSDIEPNTNISASQADSDNSADPYQAVSVTGRWENLICWHAASDHEALALIELAQTYHDDLSDYPAHPAMLDIATSFAMGSEALYLPISYHRIRMFAALTPRIWSHVTWQRNVDSLAPTITFGVRIFNDQGQLAIEIDGYTLKKSDTVLTSIAPHQAQRLTCETPGLLESLKLQPAPVADNLDPEELEISVAASGLNFLDVLSALGMSVNLKPDELGIGRECAGIVRRVGSQVSNFKPGDHVVAVAGSAFDDLVRINQLCVRPKPAVMDWATASSFAVAYMTAHFALNHRARLRPGDTVLIHAGAGGVGLAAVALAQQAGATIFATAGSDSKRTYLRSLGVDHVFDSRSDSFANEIRQITPRGVDVVLNSLGGDLMMASLQLLAPHGRFLELGKRDFALNRQIGLATLAHGVTYFSINLGPEVPEYGAVFDEVIDMVQTARVPILPIKTYDIEQIVQAFKDMAAARHIGKIVVTRTPLDAPAMASQQRIVQFDELDAPLLDEQLREGMSDAEGAQAFARALGSDLPQVLVTPQNFHELLKRNTAQAVRHLKEQHLVAGPVDPNAWQTPAATQETTANSLFIPGDSTANSTSTIATVVRETWSEYLGVAEIKPSDSFFSLGGDSLIGIQIMAQLRKRLGIDIPVAVFFETPTLEGLTNTLESLKHKDGPSEPSSQLLTIDLANKHEPFALTDVQQAYWIGRSRSFELGNVAAHGYFEVEREELDFERFCTVWMQLVMRHDMLRMVVNAEGQQQILASVPEYRPELIDLRNKSELDTEKTISKIRQQMSSQVLPSDQWPLFDIRITLLPDSIVRIHMSFDALIMDAWSSMILSREFSELYSDPTQQLPKLEISFRDYVIHDHGLNNTPVYQKAERYWLDRLQALPPAPQLPLAVRPEAIDKPSFTRREARLPAVVWQRLKNHAAQAGVTPSVACLTCFGDILARWSQTDHFSINLTLFNRPAVHPQINDLVGDFTSLTLLEIDTSSLGAYSERAKRVQQQLGRDLDHRQYSGVRVLRELVRSGQRQSGAIMPVVFTSTLTLDSRQQQRSPVIFDGRMVYGLSQTPQVWLDHGILEDNGELVLNFNSVDELFPAGMIDDMFELYQHALARLGGDWAAWIELDPLPLPHGQRLKRLAYNDTNTPLPTSRLEAGFFGQVALRSHSPAISSSQATLSYRDLHRQALTIAHQLTLAGVQPGECVGIHLPKGEGQIAAVLGVLRAGGAYVPLDPTLPLARLQAMSKGMRLAITTDANTPSLPDSLMAISLDRLSSLPNDLPKVLCSEPLTETQALAYVIYTSGSTGTPKGVMIEHQAAQNTIADLTSRFQIVAQDRVLSISSLGFDLSVFDIFALLGQGGSMVLPQPDALRDPDHWYDLLVKHQVTIWNSVPALMEVLVEYIETNSLTLPKSLRLVLLSGDWIPTTLPDRIRALLPDVQIIGMGGATEASIWSIYYPIQTVQPHWTSIPYGYPLANQTYHVLDAHLRDCPDWVTGELYIGGVGLSSGYWQDRMLSQQRFITVGEQRLYRTGDQGRFMPEGWIEFQGRNDHQVKIQGYRVEVSEVEYVLRKHPAVEKCAVKAITTSSGSRQLAAYLVVKPALAMPELESLRQFMRETLPDYMVPATFTQVQTLTLTHNGKIDYASLPAPQEPLIHGTTHATNPATNSSHIAHEVLLAVSSIIGLANVTAHQNLLDLGMDSIGMIRLANRLQSNLGLRPKIADLYRMPSIAALINWCESTSNPLTTRQTPTVAIDTPSVPLITDPAERQAFLATNHARRQFDQSITSVPLSDTSEIDRFLARTTERHFSLAPISLASFGQWIAALQQIEVQQKPKYLYASAGGLYPVQTYIHVKAGRIESLQQGLHYYDPIGHSFVHLTEAAVVTREDFDPLVNQPIFDESAFCVFFVAAMSRIEPMYGQDSQRFVHIEAGLMAQCLDLGAKAHGIGLCHVGEINATSLLNEIPHHYKPLWLLSLLGGAPAKTDSTESNDTLARLFSRVSELSPEQVSALLSAKQGKSS